MAGGRSYPLDNSGIIHLAVRRPDHSNLFRISVTLRRPVQPELLQAAFCAVTPRFPTIVAGIRRGGFEYRVVPVDRTPAIQKDPGLLHTMSRTELERCAMRIIYAGNTLSMECFHSITDGYGGFAFLNALTAEYVRLAHGERFDAGDGVLLPEQPVAGEETVDSFLAQDVQGKATFSRTYSYLPDEGAGPVPMQVERSVFRAEDLLRAARSRGVSVTCFLAAAMVRTVMEHQVRFRPEGQPWRPVQIMVPADLRRRFSSRTLRNFSLYALVRLEPEQRDIPFDRLLALVDGQLNAQFDKGHLAAMIATNTAMKRNPLLRFLPLWLKCAVLRLGFRLTGERNSCLTLSNMGQAQFSPKLQPYIQSIRTYLTPRIRSPHNCGMVTYNGRFYLNFTRYCREKGLEELFLETMADLGCRTIEDTEE